MKTHWFPVQFYEGVFLLTFIFQRVGCSWGLGKAHPLDSPTLNGVTTAEHAIVQRLRGVFFKDFPRLKMMVS